MPVGCGSWPAAASGGPFLDFFDAAHDDQAACRAAMHSDERVVIEDVTVSPVYAGTPALDVLLAAGVRAIQCTPLVGRSGRLVGMLSTHYGTPRRPRERDLHVLDLLARQAADWISEPAPRKPSATARSGSAARSRMPPWALPTRTPRAATCGSIRSTARSSAIPAMSCSRRRTTK